MDCSSRLDWIDRACAAGASPTAVRVLALALRADGPVHLGCEAMASAFGVSRQAVHKAIGRLVALGILSRLAGQTFVLSAAADPSRQPTVDARQLQVDRRQPTVDASATLDRQPTVDARQLQVDRRQPTVDAHCGGGGGLEERKDLLPTTTTDAGGRGDATPIIRVYGPDDTPMPSPSPAERDAIRKVADLADQWFPMLEIGGNILRDGGRYTAAEWRAGIEILRDADQAQKRFKYLLGIMRRLALPVDPSSPPATRPDRKGGSRIEDFGTIQGYAAEIGRRREAYLASKAQRIG